MHNKSPFGAVAIPRELNAALAGDRGAFAAFNALPHSHQQQYAHWIASGVKAETRTRRMASAIEMPKGSEDRSVST